MPRRILGSEDFIGAILKEVGEKTIIEEEGKTGGIGVKELSEGNGRE